MRFRPFCLELDRRDCPAPVRTVVALEVSPGSLYPGEADFVRSEVVRCLGPHAPRGKLEVGFADAHGVAALVRADRRSDRLQVFVIGLVGGRGPYNWWGESGGSWGRVYVEGHRDLPAEQQTGQIAVTALHELGHALGLGHPNEHDPRDVMSHGSVWPHVASYADRWVATDLGVVNAARVVRRALWRLSG